MSDSSDEFCMPLPADVGRGRAATAVAKSAPVEAAEDVAPAEAKGGEVADGNAALEEPVNATDAEVLDAAAKGGEEVPASEDEAIEEPCAEEADDADANAAPLKRQRAAEAEGEPGAAATKKPKSRDSTKQPKSQAKAKARTTKKQDDMYNFFMAKLRAKEDVAQIQAAWEAANPGVQVTPPAEDFMRDGHQYWLKYGRREHGFSNVAGLSEWKKMSKAERKVHTSKAAWHNVTVQAMAIANKSDAEAVATTASASGSASGSADLALLCPELKAEDGVGEAEEEDAAGEAEEELDGEGEAARST